MVRPAKPLKEMTVVEARQMLRTAGLRGTTSRVAILQYLATSHTPLSHSDVAEVLVPTGFDKSTLYRCLVELASSADWTREIISGGLSFAVPKTMPRESTLTLFAWTAAPFPACRTWK